MYGFTRTKRGAGASRRSSTLKEQLDLLLDAVDPVKTQEPIVADDDVEMLALLIRNARPTCAGGVQWNTEQSAAARPPDTGRKNHGGKQSE